MLMATETKPESGTKVVTSKVSKNPVRFSYAKVFQPESVNGGPAKYSVSIIIPKSNTVLIDKIKAAIALAAEEGKSTKFGGKIPNPLKQPLRDGDTDPNKAGDAAYANSYFMSASTKTKPGVVRADKTPIEDSTEFYSGCWGHASLNFYPFNSNGSKGVACGLNFLQKTKEGDALGGRGSADADFEEETEGEDLA